MNILFPHNLRAFIWYFLKSYKGFVLLMTLFATISGLWSPFNSLLIKHLVDAFGSIQAKDSILYILQLAVCFVLNFELHNLCWRSMAYLNYRFQPMIKKQIICETFGYTHWHTHQFFQDNLSGRIASQISTLADNIEWIVHDLSRHLIRTAVLLIVAFINMYIVHPKFFYVSFIWFLIFSYFSMRLSRRFIALSGAHAASETGVWGHVVDSIANASNVRIFARRLYEIFYLEKALLLTKKTFQEKESFAMKLHFFQGISLSMMLGFMLYFLIQLRTKKVISIGDLTLILSLSIDVGFTVWWTLDLVDDLNKAIGKCQQSLARLFIPLEIQDKENAHSLVITKGQITFLGVKFHYKSTNPLFQNLSVTINGGEKVGLVGYSGSGKSTFINLILRLYDVTDGQILIDNQDIRNVTQDSLRAHVAMIPQDPSLFHRTLMENIRYGRLTATDDEVIKAAKQAHAHEFIVQSAHGYDTLVGERGLKLSGGQRQRIAIARVILKNAPILILDEATSQLDTLTESYIQESLWQLMQGKTTIVIAHRLSTLLHMDRILVFDQGYIIGDGSHAELLEKNDLYKRLWKAQAVGALREN